MKKLIEQDTDSINIDELKESLNLLNGYRRAMDQAIMHFITNRYGKFKYVNQSFCEITGYREKELIGSEVSILDSNYFNKKTWDKINEGLYKGKIWKGVFKNKKKNGDSYWVRSTIIPIRDKDDKETIEIFYIQNEITDHMNSEQEKINAIIFSQEQDKESYSENLHEGIAQVLYGANFRLKSLEEKANESGNTAFYDEISDIRSYITNSIDEVRSLASDMMPRSLMNGGVEIALDSYFNHPRTCNSIEINPSIDITNNISKSIEVTMYRSVVTIIEEIIKTKIIKEVFVRINDNYDFNCRIVFTGVPHLNINQIMLVKSRIELSGGSLNARKIDGKCVVDINFEPRIAFINKI